MNEHNNATPETLIKNITLELLKAGDITVTTEDFGKSTGIIAYGSSGGSLSEHQQKLYESLGMAATTPDIEGIEDDVNAKRYHINGILLMWLSKAQILGLTTLRRRNAELINNKGSKVDIQLKTFALTPQGLDVALKIQEHDDNERRFEQQSGISDVLKDNSSKSVFTARLALALSVVLVIFGGYRVYQLEQKILSHSNMEQRIHSAEEEYSRLDEEVVRLKGELNRLIPIDNDKGKPVAVIVDSNTPATEP
jgi:cell division protein FtsL